MKLFIYILCIGFMLPVFSQEITPETASEITTEVVVPETVPEIAPETVPEIAPETVPEIAPDTKIDINIVKGLNIPHPGKKIPPQTKEIQENMVSPILSVEDPVFELIERTFFSVLVL